MIIDGIEFLPVRKHFTEIPNYFVSQCGKVYNTKREKYVKPYKVWRGKKEGAPKCMEFSVITDQNLFENCDYKSKKNNGRIELKIKLHHAVKDAWDPWDNHVKKMSREELEAYALESMLIDHMDDAPLNNVFENLQYSTPLKNSNHRKNWVDKG